jgi:hypothetical protein
MRTVRSHVHGIGSDAIETGGKPEIYDLVTGDADVCNIELFLGPHFAAARTEGRWRVQQLLLNGVGRQRGGEEVD